MKIKTILLFALLSITVGFSSCECVGVYNSFQLLSIILNSLEYEFYPNTSGHLPITEDIQIIGTVTLSSEHLIVPEECANRNDCRNQVGFEDMYGADGISLSPISSDIPGFSPSSLTLTNIKLRFRPLLIDTHPWLYNHVPVIMLMPPSDQECNGIKCEIDQVCYDRYQDYCQHCLALSHQECVCRDENGIFPDGTFCQFFISGDVIMMGECQDGECIGEGYN
ncbi:MAG: hypothetical protein KAQ81_07830 [Deltaproteobacteria bacterium]|nr:hypothetical protein [Deltaproteobacteria bacterium]